VPQAPERHERTVIEAALVVGGALDAGFVEQLLDARGEDRIAGRGPPGSSACRATCRAAQTSTRRKARGRRRAASRWRAIAGSSRYCKARGPTRPPGGAAKQLCALRAHFRNRSETRQCGSECGLVMSRLTCSDSCSQYCSEVHDQCQLFILSEFHWFSVYPNILVDASGPTPICCVWPAAPGLGSCPHESANARDPDESGSAPWASK